ncbi:MAG TPA: glycosyltransferase, partial [Candidatus Deferrimicrobiaceae bacterium]|nr:glycosyltransferase [Candidatus Deferrimicrobiaceae bacterium]
MENEKSVAIIIVNWNQKGRLAACLTSLHDKTAYTNYRTIVLDNGSADGSVQLIREMFPWVDLIALNENTGFSVANNKGITY